MDNALRLMQTAELDELNLATHDQLRTELVQALEWAEKAASLLIAQTDNSAAKLAYQDAAASIRLAVRDTDDAEELQNEDEVFTFDNDTPPMISTMKGGAL